jgi:hypothetical protein
MSFTGAFLPAMFGKTLHVGICCQAGDFLMLQRLALLAGRGTVAGE